MGREAEGEIKKEGCGGVRASSDTNLCLLAPHVQVLALGFGEMVPCSLFGSSAEYRHNLLNCGGSRGAAPVCTVQRGGASGKRQKGVKKWNQAGRQSQACVCHSSPLLKHSAVLCLATRSASRAEQTGF